MLLLRVSFLIFIKLSQTNSTRLRAICSAEIFTRASTIKWLIYQQPGFSSAYSSPISTAAIETVFTLTILVWRFLDPFGF